MPSRHTERQQEETAAAEAAAIGGPVSSDPPAVDDARDPAQRPLEEAGEGEAEGFELAERQLIERASHGDQHAARRVIEDAPDEVDDPRAAPDAEADAIESSEREDRP